MSHITQQSVLLLKATQIKSFFFFKGYVHIIVCYDNILFIVEKHYNIAVLQEYVAAKTSCYNSNKYWHSFCPIERKADRCAVIFSAINTQAFRCNPLRTKGWDDSSLPAWVLRHLVLRNRHCLILKAEVWRKTRAKTRHPGSPRVRPEKRKCCLKIKWNHNWDRHTQNKTDILKKV